MGFFDNLFGKGKSFSDSLKYVDDYKTELVKGERGRTRKKTTYIGTWFCIREGERDARAKMIASALLGAAAAACLVGLLLTDHAGSGWLPVSIPKALALFPMLYLMMGVLSLPFSQKPMHRDRYMHSFIRASRSAAAVLVLEGVSLLMSVLFRFIYKDALFLKGDWHYLAFNAASFLCAALVLRLLYTVAIAELPNAAYDEGEVKHS